MIRIIGNHVSPYARKVFLALDHKEVDYEIDPIVPFFGGDDFTRLNPLRRIPVLIDGDLVIPDSTVICEYLDDRFPERPLYPADPAQRARARWLEEFADSRLGDVMIWKLFFQRNVKPRVWKQETDEALVAQVVAQDLPEVMDWLEPQAPAAGYMFDDLSMTDLTFASFFRNAALAGWSLDAERWPRVAAWIDHVQATPLFARSVMFEQIMLTTPGREVAAALTAGGLKVAATSVRGDAPRRGPMSV
ncbi:glutathione S-transferase family protein [Sphingomonas sp.]|jgi:glutathione S-transferase|uniref:glutathione S-transferase family protein n=1 Tax=Sphingomonas sp. TaxID=28214 RepID=UPI002E3195CB|nr:glutathione S-transferase family protein [Sphingomonas sp.]HEX4694854.1 glutathione S-transferase family protein [Sphingomonas sp.]